MSRVTRTKYTGGTPDSMPGNYLISIGAKPPGKNHPTKLPGIVIRKNIQKDGTYPVDYEIMQRLQPGFDKAAYERAEKAGLGGVGLLPTKILCQIPYHMEYNKVGEFWDNPRFYTSEYRWPVKGCTACHGNGTSATRRMPDGTYRPWPCVPAGCGHPEEQECPESAQKLCTLRTGLALRLLAGIQDGVPIPLCPSLGGNALFVYKTKNQYAPTTLGLALDDAAKECRGIVAGLIGLLTFESVGRNAGPKIGRVPAGQLTLQIEMKSIEDRKRKLEGLYITEARTSRAEIAANAPTLLIEGPDDPDADDDIDNHDDSETIDIPQVAAAGPVDSPAPPSPSGNDSGAKTKPAPPPVAATEEGNAPALPSIISDNTDEVLLTALVDFAGDAFGEIATFEYTDKDGNDQLWEPESPQWFLNAEDQDKNLKRRGYLRELCLGYAEDEAFQAAVAKARGANDDEGGLEF